MEASPKPGSESISVGLNRGAAHARDGSSNPASPALYKSEAYWAQTIHGFQTTKAKQVCKTRRKPAGWELKALSLTLLMEADQP